MPFYAILAAVLAQIVWGGNYSAAKFTLIDFPPMMANALRFALLSCVLLPFVWREGWPGWRRQRDYFIIGFTTLVLNFGMMLVAMGMGLNVTSSILAVQLGVPFSCILAAIFFKDYLGPWRSGGLMVAFCGVVVIAGTPNAFEHSTAFLIAIFSGLAWSAGNLYLKVMKPSRIVPLLFWPGLMTMLMMGALSLVFEHGHAQHIAEASWHGWAGIAYGALISSIVGYGLWNNLMTRYPVSQVVPFSLLLPIAGISGGVVFFDEPFTLRILLGAAMTIGGVAIIALRRPRLMEAEKA